MMPRFRRAVLRTSPRKPVARMGARPRRFKLDFTVENVADPMTSPRKGASPILCHPGASCKRTCPGGRCSRIGQIDSEIILTCAETSLFFCLFVHHIPGGQ